MYKFKLVVWAFISEIVLAILCLVLTKKVLSDEYFLKFFVGIESDIAMFGGAMFAASLAFLWTFYSKIDSDFYVWLSKKHALRPFLLAIAYVVFISSFCVFVFIYIKSERTDLNISLAFFILFLTIINLYTMVKNVIDLMLLNVAYNEQKNKEN